MRLLYVVQRYGETIAGGAEQHCREMAERMAQRGHRRRGRDLVRAVVRRLGERRIRPARPRSTTSSCTGSRSRTLARQPAVQRAATGAWSAAAARRPLAVQREWLRMQGPYAPALHRLARPKHGRFDCVICFTYLYWTTVRARSTGSRGACPLVLHPTVHDEPPLRLSLFDTVFRAPTRSRSRRPRRSNSSERRFHFDAARRRRRHRRRGRRRPIRRAVPRRVRPRRHAVPALRRAGRRRQGRGRAARLLRRVQAPARTTRCGS